MHALIYAAVTHARTVLLLLAFVIISGIIAYLTIPKEASPDVQIPYIYVSVSLDGISPEDAERLLLRPLEKKLNTVTNVKEMTSEAVEGFASVSLEFSAGFDSDKALADVRAKVDEAKPELPEEADEPVVTELNFSTFPILNINLTGDIEERILLGVARGLRDKIETISQVLEVKINGDREEVLDIIINPRTLETYNISPAEVFQKVDNNNILVAAGQIDTGKGRFSIKVPGLVETLKDLRDIPLRVQGEAVTTLKDIADIKRHFKDADSYARVNGKPGLVLAVSKRTGANIIETVEKVRAVVEQERQRWPAGVEVIYSQDESDRIYTMLSDLQNNILLAMLLVLVVVILVMGIRSAGLIAFAIPGAFLFGILCVSMFGFTLNVVVLFSLILSVGMLVDAAIVVCEYADRLLKEGVPRSKAYPQAAIRMAWPIITSTITTLVVFMPLLVWPGTVGQFMKYMPITLIVTLTGSLLMALIFIPTLGTKLGKKVIGKENSHDDWMFSDDAEDLNKAGIFYQRYARILYHILQKPWHFIGMIVATMIMIIAIFANLNKGVEFFPDIEPENARVLVKTLGNLSIDEKDALVKKVEQQLAALDGIRVMSVQVGKVERRSATEDTIGIITMEFSDWRDRPNADDILAKIRSLAKNITGIQLETVKQEQGPPVGKPIQLEFSSHDSALLMNTVRNVGNTLRDVSGLINIENNLPIPEIEWEIQVNKELAGRYDIDVNMVGQVVKLVSNGLIVNAYRPDDADDEIDIIVRFPEEYRNLSQLDRLRVFTPEGQVPIGQYISRIPAQKVTSIARVEGKRAYTIKADIEPGLIADKKLQDVQQILSEMNIDPAVQVRFRGEDEEQQEAGIFLASAFVVALSAMFVLLVTQFNSMYAAFVILSAVFFSTGGVLLGLLITEQPFGIVMCGVGIISLAGIVVNNNIIFIDTFKQLYEKGIDTKEALIRTGMQRLRPILLTAGTTVLGLMPMVLGMNINFITRETTFGAPSTQWWNQLSTSIAGGLAFATILTLFFTPCLLMIGSKMSRNKRHHEE